jgi:WD repeat-containing protein 35
LACICSFKELIITAVDFISLYNDPLKPSLAHFHRYESKSLRDLRFLVQCEGISAEEILTLVKEKSHPKLWQILAEANLAAMNLQAAERCFIEGQIVPGVHFMKKLTTVARGDLQRGYIAWFLRKYEDAERFFQGRPDLAIQMYASIGNWVKVAELGIAIRP